MMVERTDFAGFVEGVVAREMAPLDHSVHPRQELLLDGLAGALDPVPRSQLMAHLATCAPCRARWDRLSAELVAETSRLDAQTRVPSLARLARAHRREHALATASWKEQLRAWAGSLVYRGSLRPAFAVLGTAVAAAALTLAIALPLLRGPVIASNRAVSELRAQVARLEDKALGLSGALASLQSGVAEVGQRVAGLPDTVSTQLASGEHTSSRPWARFSGDLTHLAATAELLPDPVQRPLYVVNALQRYGILDLSWFDWADLRTYTAIGGEMWSDIAAYALGRWGAPSLWPLVWVLNSEIAGPFDPLPGGASVRVPSAK